MKFDGWRVTRWASVALLLMVALVLFASGWNEDSLRLVVRSTARTSFGLFLLAFSASSLCRLWPASSTRWMLRNRRYIGVSFAVSHFLHLGALASLALAFPQPFLAEQSMAAVLGGALGYAFIAAMALTSSDGAQAWLGRRWWRRLHLVGSYYVWGIFAQSYLGRAWVDSSYVPYAVAVAGVLILRAAPYLRDAIRRTGAPVAQ